MKNIYSYLVCTLCFNFHFKAGWRKWAAHHPDWYARRAESRHPDWYNRKVNYTRNSDIKNMMWTWDKTDKPTFKKTFGITREPPKPVQKGYQATPHNIEGQVQMPRWGLYHPDFYQEKCGVEPLPPLHSDMKHM